MKIMLCIAIGVFIGFLHPARLIAQPMVPVELTDNLIVADDFASEVAFAKSHFPELKHVSVEFRFRKSYATLKTRPTFGSLFMPKGHRSYVIIISNKTIDKLMPVTFDNLPEEARIGILSHELSHVVDFSKKTSWQSLQCAIDHYSCQYLDSLEYHTDKICIEHGLGNYLESWSNYVRTTMHTTYWRGADYVNKGDMHIERYMNPDTIEKYTKTLPK